MQARSAQNRARRPAAVHKQRPAHASWAQRPQDRQAARGAWRSSSLTQPTQPPPRCSRSALLTLLTAPAEPDPEGLPGAGRLQLGSETAARTCQRDACGLPAAAVLPAAGALSVRTVCSGPAAAAASLIGPWSVRQLLEVFGGAGGCRAWHWAGAETCLVVKI
jgi:hypothetical protein